MKNTEYKFEDFLLNVEDVYKDFVDNINQKLLKKNYISKIESKASGFFVSYSHPKTKRGILNLLFRKKGLLVRIYGDNCNKYSDLLNKLPENIINQIEKAGVCKRLINPESCNQKCPMGYDFYIGKKHYQKCRNSCFYLEFDTESIPFIVKIIDKEMKEREE